MRIRAGRRPPVILLAGILAIGLACTKAPDDSQLTSQIQSKLNEDSGLHGKPIAVQTSGGVVTISGTVENETQREAAAPTSIARTVLKSRKPPWATEPIPPEPPPKNPPTEALARVEG